MNACDIVLIVLLIVFVLIGASRGLIMTLCGLVVAVLALSGANAAAEQFTPVVAEAIRPGIEESVQKELTRAVEENGLPEIELSPELAFEEDSLLGQLVSSELYQRFAASVEETVGEGMETAVESAAASVAVSLAQSVAWALIYLAAFILILFVGNLVGRVLDTLALLPGLHFVNKTLGGVCGFVEGAVILAALSFLGLAFGLIPAEAAEGSFLLGLIAPIHIFFL